MFTVMFIDSRSQAQMERFSLLFNPYCSEGKIAFAKWNTAGYGFDETFPDLYGILKGKEKWRALFVIEPENLKCKNVYDRPNHMSGKIYAKFEKEEDYVIRASQILGGIHRKVRTKVVKDLRDKDGDLLPPEIQTEPIAPSEELLAQYYLPVTPPIEIAFFSKRMEEEKETGETPQYLLPENEKLIASLFYERNNYPNLCRFIVFDIVDSTHIDYQFMLLKFYMCILTYAVNDIEPNLLQAYRLYSMDCTIDRDAMRQFLSFTGSRIATLIDALKAYDTYTGMPRLDPDLRYENFERIPLVYENCDYFRLHASGRLIGLVKDVSADEPMWDKQMTAIMREFGFFLKVPGRALSIAASEARAKSRPDISELKALDKFQMEDFEEFVDKTGIEVFSMDTAHLFDRKGYYRALGEKGKAVRDEMSQRMTGASAVRGFLIMAALYILGMAPVFIASMETGEGLPGPMGIALFSLAFIAGGGLIMLIIDKRRLKSRIARFNAAMNSIINEISAAMDTFSDYLSKVCAYIKGQATIEELKKIKTDRDYRNSRVAERLLYAYKLKNQYAYIAECMNIEPGQYENKQYFDDLNLLMFYKDIGAQLLTHVLPDKERIGIFSTELGEASKADAPYRFVSSISLRREELYELIPKEILK